MLDGVALGSLRDTIGRLVKVSVRLRAEMASLRAEQARVVAELVVVRAARPRSRDWPRLHDSGDRGLDRRCDGPARPGPSAAT